MSDEALLYELRTRVAELERRVAALDGGPAPAGPAADPEILGHLRSGNMIAAIKRYRELTGVGLAEAKHAVEQMGV